MTQSGRSEASATQSKTGIGNEQDSPKMITRISFGLAAVLFIGLFLSRSFAQQFDFAVANILTLILGFFSWLSLAIGLATSKLPRLYWRVVALTPIIALLIFFAMYRVVRIDGELVPKFVSRWKSPEKPAPVSEIDSEQNIDPAKLETRPTDFPQFMGPDRSGVVKGVALHTDWKSNPPQIAWKHAVGAGWSGFAVQGDVAITLEQREKEQWIAAYDITDGKALWATATPGVHFNALGGIGPRSTPTIDQGRVFVQTATGQVLALELSSGKKLWDVDLLKIAEWTQEESEAEIAWGRSGSPLVVDNLVILPLGGRKDDPNRSLIALDREDGHTVWRSGKDQISYSSPAFAKLLGEAQVLIVNETTFTGHDLTTGNILWEVPWPGQSDGSASVSQPVVLSDSRVLISKGYSQGAQLIEFKKSDTGEWSFATIWRESASLKTKFTSPVVYENHAYGLSDGILECIDVSTGKRKWKKGRYRQGQLLLVDNVLLITSESGAVVLVAADPSDHHELASLPVIGDVSWNTPALSGNRLLIRNAEEAACLHLPLK